VRTKVLWLKDEYLAAILDGLKTVEVRVAYSNITRLEVGDCLLLNGTYPFAIHRIGRYGSFADLLAHENHASIAHGVSPDDLLCALRELYPPDREALGVVALEIAPYTTWESRSTRPD
jgi:ASC-1-like (ASCH) protein